MSYVRFLLLALLLVGASGQARHLTREEYFAFRATIEMPPGSADDAVAGAVEDYTLPTSVGYDQGGSALCWAFATLNVIETDWLAKHPGSKIALSRTAIQRLNMEWHYQGWLKDASEAGCWECGNVPGALYLIGQSGLYAATDYRPAPAKTKWTKPFPIEAKEEKAKKDELAKKLDENYGPLPAQTHSVEGTRVVPPKELAKEAMPPGDWLHEYTKAKYPEFIRDSLKRRHGLVVFWHGHLEEIYGATYDDKGELTSLRIKGSYGPNFLYTVQPKALEQCVWLSRPAN